MKISLRKGLQFEINRIDSRCSQLWNHRELYKESNDFAAARKCDIEWKQLKSISQSLKKLLATT
jgi:hypothetical protein